MNARRRTLRSRPSKWWKYAPYRTDRSVLCTFLYVYKYFLLDRRLSHRRPLCQRHRRQQNRKPTFCHVRQETLECAYVLENAYYYYHFLFVLLVYCWELVINAFPPFYAGRNHCIRCIKSNRFFMQWGSPVIRLKLFMFYYWTWIPVIPFFDTFYYLTRTIRHARNVTYPETKEYTYMVMFSKK